MLANELNDNEKNMTKLREIFHYVKTLDNIYPFLRHTQGLFYNTKYSKTWKRIVTNPKVNI